MPKSQKIRSAPMIDGVAATTINGRVTSGFGIANSLVRKNYGLIRRSIGENFIDGSLNVVLRRPLMLKRETAIQIRFEQEEDVQLQWPGKLNGLDVWLHRWDGAPLHVLEIMSTVHLRTHMNLSDGDEVQIAIRESDIGRVSGVGMLVWVLLWLGRTKYSYSLSREPARRWSKRFGATQLDARSSVLALTMALVKVSIKKLLGVPRLLNNPHARRHY